MNQWNASQCSPNAGDAGNTTARALPVSPPANSARSDGPNLIEPAAQHAVFGQAGIVWGQLWGLFMRTVCALRLLINDLE